MKTKYFLILLCFCSIKIFATHNKAGNITYVRDIVFPLRYHFTMSTYTKTSSPADRPSLTLFWGDGTSDTVPRISKTTVGLDISENIYEGTHDYPALGTYIVYLEDPNRNAGVVNIPGSVNVPFFIESQLVIDPVLAIVHSPQFFAIPIFTAHINTPFIQNMTAYDLNGDLLSYELIPCLTTGGIPVPGYFLPPAFSIDTLNGEVTWFTPQTLGEFNFAVKVKKWRNGALIGYVIRDFAVEVIPQAPGNFYFSGNASWNVDVNGNYSYAVNAGSTIQLNLDYTDLSTASVNLMAYSDAFMYSNPAVFLKTLSFPTIYSTFTWATNASNVRSSPYVITFRGISADTLKQDVTLMICVYDNLSTPCVAYTSVGELSNYNEIAISPNPVTDYFELRVGNIKLNKQYEIKIFDILGTEIFQSESAFGGPKSEIKVDVSELAKGIYVIEVRGENVYRGKFVKQ